MSSTPCVRRSSRVRRSPRLARLRRRTPASGEALAAGLGALAGFSLPEAALVAGFGALLFAAYRKYAAAPVQETAQVREAYTAMSNGIGALVDNLVPDENDEEITE